MYNFGKLPPRSLQSFGVAGLLGSGCRVFYDTLFNTTGLGRVSDLLSARLREAKLDELKLRAVLLFGFFEAYQSQFQVDNGALQEPLTLECGFDDEKIAVGVSFACKTPADEKARDLVNAIHSHSDHSVLRISVADSRVEIVALLAIPGKMELGAKQPLTVIEVPAGAVPPEATEYVQLGDLDYSELLKDRDGKESKKGSFSTGEFVAKTFSEGAPEETKATVIAAAPSAELKDSALKFAAEAKDENRIQSMLGKVWPFKKKPDSTEPGKGAEHSSHELPEFKATNVSIPEFKDTDVKGMAEYLNTSFSSGSFHSLVEKNQELLRELRKGDTDPATRQWLETFATDILAEKIRVVEVSKMVQKGLSRLELEQKTREAQFADDLRRKDEELKLKSAALEHSKEYVAQMTAQIDHVKTGSKTSSAEEAALKHKLQLSQKMLTSLRDENTKIAAKLEEAKKQLLTAPKGPDPGMQAELTSLKAKHEQVIRQNVQMKNMNEQLLRRMQQSVAKNEKAAKDAAAAEDIKKKLEIVERELAGAKEKAELATKEQGRIARELYKKDVEFRKLQAEMDALKKVPTEPKKAS